MPPPGSGRDCILGVGQMLAVECPAGHRKARVCATLAPKLVNGKAHELVDVTDVVGEQDEVLEMVGIGTGVMPQPGKAEVRPRPVKECKWTRLAT